MTRTVPARTQVARFAVSLSAGFVSGFLVARLARLMGATRDTLGWADDAALMLAAVLTAMAAYLLMIAADRRRLARALECDAELPASTDEVDLMRLQAAVLALAGVLLALPVLMEPAARADRAHGLAALAAAAAVFGLQTWANLGVWRRSDEVLRAAVVKAAGWAFWVGQGLLFLWAAAEKLAAAPALHAWQAVVILLSLYLLASSALALRLRRA